MQIPFLSICQMLFFFIFVNQILKKSYRTAQLLGKFCLYFKCILVYFILSPSCKLTFNYCIQIIKLVDLYNPISMISEQIIQTCFVNKINRAIEQFRQNNDNFHIWVDFYFNLTNNDRNIKH